MNRNALARVRLGRMDVVLRAVVDEDLTVFFENGRDPEAARMAAFTAKDPEDREVFARFWEKIRREQGVTIRTVLVDGAVAGSVMCYPQEGRSEVTSGIRKPDTTPAPRLPGAWHRVRSEHRAPGPRGASASAWPRSSARRPSARGRPAHCRWP